MIRKLAGAIVLLLVLGACARQAAAPIQLAVVPTRASADDGNAALVAEGLGALLLSQLRAMPGATVRIDPRGCAATEATTHVLEITRQDSGQSALILLRLHGCQDRSDHRETLVQPRDARRDWSGEAAYWVAGVLEVPIALTAPGASVSAIQMDQFLVAVARLNRRTREDIAAARSDLLTVVAAHPDFALGQAQLAAAELLAYEYGIADRGSAQRSAQTAIDAALAVDPDLGLAHAARGLSLMMDARYRDAALVLARAAALDPGDAAIHLWLGNALLYSGRPSEAIAWLDDAIRIEPQLSAARTSRAEAACYSGDQTRCRAFLEQPSKEAIDGFVRALLRAHRGEFSAARADLERSPQVNEVWALELKSDVCTALQDPNCMQQTLEELIKRFPAEPETTRLQARQQPVADPDMASAVGAPFGEIDLWQIGLGLDALMSAAAESAAAQTRLQSVLQELKQGGLDLPVLQVAAVCLRVYRGDFGSAAAAREALASTGYRHPELWRRWQCDAAS